MCTCNKLYVFANYMSLLICLNYTIKVQRFQEFDAEISPDLLYKNVQLITG